VVVRIGDRPVQAYVEECLKKRAGIILLARGGYISKAVDVCNQLRTCGYELFPEDILGFKNPEIGTWRFVQQPKKKTSHLCEYG
jgi:DNA-binding protein